MSASCNTILFPSNRAFTVWYQFSLLFYRKTQRGRKLQSRVNRVTLAAVSEAHRIFKQRTKAGRALDFTDSSARRGRKRNKTNDERDSSRHFRKEVLRRAGFTVAGESELFIFKTAGVHGFCFPLFLRCELQRPANCYSWNCARMCLHSQHVSLFTRTFTLALNRLGLNEVYLFPKRSISSYT